MYNRFPVVNFTLIGLTYPVVGASRAGMCSGDEVKSWRPPSLWWVLGADGTHSCTHKDQVAVDLWLDVENCLHVLVLAIEYSTPAGY